MCTRLFLVYSYDAFETKVKEILFTFVYISVCVEILPVVVASFLALTCA